MLCAVCKLLCNALCMLNVTVATSQLCTWKTHIKPAGSHLTFVNCILAQRDLHSGFHITPIILLKHSSECISSHVSTLKSDISLYVYTSL